MTLSMGAMIFNNIRVAAQEIMVAMIKKITIHLLFRDLHFKNAKIINKIFRSVKSSLFQD
jgi:hypothetical protein